MATTDETTYDGGTSETDWQGELIEVNWEFISMDELKKWRMRQADYTRKTQELSAMKAQPQADTSAEEVNEYLANFMKQQWVVTRDELEKERRYSQIMDENPDLKPFGDAIKKLSESEQLAPEDIIEKYWFASKDKLSKAKERGILWDKPQQSRSISEMTDKEWAEFQAKNKKGTSFERVQEF